MKKIKTSLEQFSILKHLLKWTVISIPLAIIIGSVVAFFLYWLEHATNFRQSHSWLLLLLPFAGVFIYFLYKWSGKNAEQGNNLIINQIHEPSNGVPLRMAPLVLLTTVITHLFGGSAGREGTAVQIGGSISSFIGKRFKLGEKDVRILLMTGIAAGFGSVFGTPITGAIFALEVLTVGRINHNALLPCLMASVAANITCKSWGIEHTQYAIAFKDAIKTYGGFIQFNVLLLFKVIIAGVCFGLASFCFSSLCEMIKTYSNRWVKTKWLIPFVGGCMIISLTYILGTDSYLGLGVSNPNANSISILSCFKDGGATQFSWFWKLLFTAITLSMGFKGGEVTPLFFIGAALGNTIAVLTGAPVDLMAALGFIGVFAGATNTPVACTMMGVELFGSEYALYFAVACFTAYYFSGHSGIYHAQRLGFSKLNAEELKQKQTLQQIQHKS
ncbi:MAG TPA: voltage-gated chloride channel family protein [Arachidicoccus sp.]